MKVRTLTRASALHAALAAVLLIGSGCSGTPVASSASASADGLFCERFAQFSQAVEDFRALDPGTATPEEYRAAWGNVETTFVATSQTAALEGQTEWSVLAVAVRDLDQTMEHLPPDSSPEEAAEFLRPELTAVETARQSIADNAGCPVG